MTEQQREELKRVLAEQTARHMTSPEEARAFLIKTGTYTADGQLAPEFGGPAQKTPKAS